MRIIMEAVHGFLLSVASELLSILDLGLILASFFTAIMYLIVLAFKPYDKEAKEQKEYLLKNELDRKQAEGDTNQFGVFLQMMLISAAYCIIKAGWFNTTKGLLQLSWQDELSTATEVVRIHEHVAAAAL